MCGYTESGFYGFSPSFFFFFFIPLKGIKLTKWYIYYAFIDNFVQVKSK